jgi:3-oxoacyl-[acyl-carrier protein] reductase
VTAVPSFRVEVKGEALSQEDGRVALVSGGSRGIGAAIALKLAADGWDISFCYLGDEEPARQVEKAVSELGVRVVAVQADITDPAQVSSWFGRAMEELGPVQAVVSCAGITRDRPLTLMEDDDWRAVIDTGLDGVFHLCRTAVPAMMKQRSGRILTVSSVCAAYDYVGPGHEVIARPGIAGFVKALAGQTARYGVSVNAVTPGPLAQDMTAILPDRNHSLLRETIALRRFGDAAAVAELVVFLLSDEAGDINGCVLEVHSAFSL